MRYIRRKGQPPQELIDAAEDILKQLESATTHQERKDIIDNNRQVYRDFHDWLLEQSHGNCWFSDTGSLFNYFDVEHYRPKKESKDVDGKSREGYWWLSFDWKNLRICGNVGNRKKGAYFPLNDEGRAATAARRSIHDEVPMLLDPADEWDATIVKFNEKGDIVPSPDATPLDLKRLEISVTRYKLDYERLVEGRKIAWGACQRLINKCENEIQEYRDSQSPVCRAQINSTMRELGELVNHRKNQLSSVAVSCLLASGFDWAQRIAATDSPDE